MPLARACVFDVDGLLIDSERVYTECTNEALAPYGKTVEPELKKLLMGVPAMVSAENVVRYHNLPLTPEEFDSGLQKLLHEGFKKVGLMPGAQELIAKLHAAKVPIAIGTGSSKKSLAHKTAHLRHVFDLFGEHVVTADDPRVEGRGKPDPRTFIVAAESLGVLPEHCVVFEDSMVGIDAAHRGKMHCVWVPDPSVIRLVGADMPHPPTQKLESLAHFDPSEWGLL